MRGGGPCGDRLPARSGARPFADQSRIAPPLMKMPDSHWDASIHCPLPVRSRWYSAASIAEAKL